MGIKYVKAPQYGTVIATLSFQNASDLHAAVSAMSTGEPLDAYEFACLLDAICKGGKFRVHSTEVQHPFFTVDQQGESYAHSASLNGVLKLEVMVSLH